MSSVKPVDSGSVDPSLFDDLEARGIIKQTTAPELKAALARSPMTLYVGFDPTSDSVHIGTLLPIMTLRRFQQAGHRVIALVGGATGMIGDPSGKSQERQLLDSEQLKINQAGIAAVLSKFLDFKGPNPAKLVNNADWFEGVSYIDFLRDVGKHFTINHMMAKESVRARLEDREHGISYTEFSYMLLQAYDFHVLNQQQGCRLQIGGSDQWGNITAGIELIRRIRAAESMPEEHVFGLTHPLVTKADGSKFGKSEAGTIWLDEKKTSPYQLYQYLIQTADADVITLLHYFSFLPVSEIAKLAETLKIEPEKRLAQSALAREVTRIVHGDAELAKVEGASQALFSADISTLDERTLLSTLSEAPSSRRSSSVLAGAGWSLIDALAESGLCASKGAARKDVAGGGIYVNNIRIADAAMALSKSNLIAGSYIVLRKGKKNYHLLAFDA